MTDGQSQTLPPEGYQLLTVIGEGGMGVVWHARDLRFNRDVAVKLLKSDVPGDSPAAQRFLAEARLTGQLQHPNIPAVHELGTLPDGRPFLAMKLVKGQTLSQLLKPDRLGPGNADRSRFIANFEQVCHAVGYAHAHGVIHRDLKPSNVMVGAHGEVQVMDWGLAKVLGARSEPEGADPSDPEATLTPDTDIVTPAQAGSVTRTGSVLGTPSYMPPEQAGGEIHKLDARSDVFGLGAILCEILTGRPPYRGASLYEVRLQAVRWEIEDAFARLDASGAEPELIALCKRCLAKQQADRPADGNEVAQQLAAIRQAAEERARRAELEKAQMLIRASEQAKRRRLAVVLSGAIAAVLLAGLTLSVWQMRRAISAEKRARAHAKQAEWNAAQARAERDEKEKQRRRAEAALAAETKARAAERQARDQAMAALRVMTDELVERQLARAPVLTEENQEFLRKVIEQFEGFATITANDADSRAIRAEGYARVGLMRDRLGDLVEAEESYRQALKLYEELVADFHTRPEYSQELARSYHNLSILLRATGRLKEAEESNRQALKLYAQLATDYPTRPDYREDLAGSHNNLGNVLYATGRLNEAEESYRQALKLYAQLAAEYPTRPDYRQHLAMCYNNLGILVRTTSRLNEAEESYRQALKLCTQLAAEYPSRPDCCQDLAGSHNNLGSFLYATSRLSEAEESYRQALKLYARLCAEYPTRPDYRQELATTHNNLGVVLKDAGRLNEAEESYRQALKLREQLAADFPTRPDYRQDLATSLNNLAILLRDTGRLNEAEKSYRQALELREQLATEYPTRPDYRQDLAVSHNNLGILLMHGGRMKEAEGSLRQTLKLYAQLVAEYPTRHDYSQELAASHNNLGHFLRATGRPKEAEEAYGQALKLREQLATDLPNEPEVQNSLAGTLINLAILCNQQRDYAAAKEYLEKAQPYHQALLRANPQHSMYRRLYRKNLVALVQTHAGLLEQAAAVETAQTVRDLGWDPPADAYDAACALSLCIPIIEQHEKLNDEKRKFTMQFYSDEAMKLLHDAVGKGFREPAYIKQDSDLVPLRQREDFQKLLEELETKSAGPESMGH